MRKEVKNLFIREILLEMFRESATAGAQARHTERHQSLEVHDPAQQERHAALLND
jgi:hypothetical protein